jgi:hypothetical protein
VATRIPVTSSFAGGRTLASILLPHINKANTFPQLLSRVNDIIDTLNIVTNPTIQDLFIDVNELADSVANGGGGGGGGGNAYGTFEVAGQANLVATQINAIATFVGSTGLNLTTNAAAGTLTFTIDGSVLTVNNATHVFGKLEGDLNVNSAAVAFLANNSVYFGGQLPSFYANVVNLTGVLAASQLPYASFTQDGIVSNTVQSLRGAKTWGDTTLFQDVVTINAAATVNGTMHVVGNTTFDGFANIAGTLQVTGLSTLTGNATLAGFANIATTLQVAGATLVNGLLTANASLTVNGVSILGGNATMSGTFANVTGTFDVTGITTLKANVLVTGAQLNVSTGNIHAGGNLVIDGLTTLTGFANVGGKLVVAGNAAITGNLTQTGNATFSGFANVVGTFQVGGATILNGLLTANAALAVNGTLTLNKDINANGSAGSFGLVLATAGPGGNVFWASVGGGGLVPDANSSVSGLINTAAQIINGNKTWLGITTLSEFFSTLVYKGNTTAAMTIDWSAGNEQYANVNANVTITLSNPQDGGRYAIWLNSGSGAWGVTWPGTVLWPDGRAPILTQGSGKTDIFVLKYSTTLAKYLGSYNQNYATG